MEWYIPVQPLLMIVRPIRSTQDSRIRYDTQSRRCYASYLEFEEDEVREIDSTRVFLGEVQGER